MFSAARHRYAVNAGLGVLFDIVSDRGRSLALVVGPRLAVYLYRLPEQGHALDANDPILDAEVIELAIAIARSHFLPLVLPAPRDKFVRLAHNFERHPHQRLFPLALNCVRYIFGDVELVTRLI